MSLNLAKCIKSYPDFPKKGIIFRDFLPLVKNGKALHIMVNKITRFASSLHVNVIVGPEARAFLIGPPAAYKLGIGFVPARKPGKLPGNHVSASYGLEYGKSTLEMETGSIKPGERVLIVDDLIATGGTANATINLVKKLGGKVVGAAFVIELSKLNGRNAIRKYLDEHNFISLIKY